MKQLQDNVHTRKLAPSTKNKYIMVKTLPSISAGREQLVIVSTMEQVMKHCLKLYMQQQQQQQQQFTQVTAQ